MDYGGFKCPFPQRMIIKTHYDPDSVLRLNLNFNLNQPKVVKMNTLTLILNTSSKSVVLKLFHVKDPPKLHVLGRRPPYRKRSETEISVTEDSFEKNIFKNRFEQMLRIFQK